MDEDDPAFEVARTRLDDRRPRPTLVLVAATLGVIAVLALTIAGSFLSPTTSAPSSSPSRPDGATSASPTGSEPPAFPAYGAGQLLRATGPFTLSGDWNVGVGQSLYVVSGERRGTDVTYTIQHWGDATTGLKPDTVVDVVSASLVERNTEPYEPACPITVEHIDDVAFLQPFERLVCFGDGMISFGPVRRQEYAVMQGNPPWLADEAGPDFLTALPFEQAAGIEVPIRRWLRITGHFDDSACAGDVRCRERLVVTAFEKADPPAAELQGTWQRMADPPIRGRPSYLAIPIDRGTFIWGGDGPGQRATGAIYDAESDRWTKITQATGLDRFTPAAAWSGRQVLIWGGNDALQDGLAYDPDRDRWSAIPKAPISGASAVGAWTGSEFVVVTGESQAAAWDPSTRTWRRLPDPPVPAGYLESVWTGRELIVLGLGNGGNAPIVGAAFDPAMATWRTIAQVPYSGQSLEVPPRWTGIEMVFVRHAYDPASDRWRRLRTDDCFGSEAFSYKVWTGRWLVSQTVAYDLAAGTCKTLPPIPARPEPGYPGEVLTHEFHTPFWSAGRLVIWSGGTGADGGGSGPDGAVFVPAVP
ncbi:MAG: hypothetical protein ABJC39_12245 [Chloroflexota bacterium]